MESEDMAKLIAGKSLKYSDFQECLESVLGYLEGLSVFNPININEIIQMWAKYDSRVFHGNLVQTITLDTEKFNPNGNIFLGKTKMREIRDNKEFGILYLYKKGL